MSNIEKAADVIDDWTKDGNELNSAVGSPHAIARLLADAGLLAPELPQPILYSPEAGDAVEWNWGDGESIYQFVAVQKGTIYFGLEVPDDLKLQPSQARSIALCLLAAYAEVTDG